MSKKHTLLISVLVLTFVVLSPTLQNGWTNLDDPIYILENPLIRVLSWDGISNMFTTFHVNGSYNPLVLLSWAIDYALSSYSPATYHITNLILHLIVTGLIFQLTLLLSKDRWVAFGTSLLFGIHPMHVEAVAWITARKDLLYTLFYVAGLIVYFLYLKQHDRKKWYYLFFCFILFAGALFSKGSAITFPLILWAIDYVLKRKGLQTILLEKIPFLALSVVFTVVAIKAQALGEALQFRAFYSVFDSMSVGFYGYFDYLIKLIVPYRLSALHPYPTPSGTPVPLYFTAAAIPVLAIAGYCFYWIKTKRVLVFGFGFFFITLIPVIQVLSFAVSVTADRFTYLPYFGLFFLMSSGVVWLINKKSTYKKIILGIAAVFVVCLSVVTFRYSKLWENSETVWTRVIKHYPNYFVSYVNRAAFKIDHGDYTRALEDCRKAITLKPDYYLAFYNLGYIYQELGDIKSALDNYTKAITLKENASEAYQNRGILYVNLGRYEEAMTDFNKAILMNPKDPMALLNRASLWRDMKRYEQVVVDATKIIALDTTLLKAYYLRGLSYGKINETKKAISDLDRACLDPTLRSNALKERGVVYIKSKAFIDGLTDFENSLKLNPNQADLYLLKANVHWIQHDVDATLYCLDRAERLTPNTPDIYYLRSRVYQEKGAYQTALKILEKGMTLLPDSELLKTENLNLLNTISDNED
jgi:tetratricopeptide (TPR) repeat protein